MPNKSQPAPQQDPQQFSEWLANHHTQARECGDTPRAETIAHLMEEWRCANANAAAQAAKPLAWKRYVALVFFWILMLELARLALHSGIDQRAVGAGLLLAAMASHAFTAIVSLVAMLPIVGPLIVKILSIPIIWLLNSIGYLVSIVAIRRGYSKDVMTYRGLTMALITGIVIGYLIGKLI